MAGHSKWKQIKHKKALLDGKKAKRFTKLIKEMTIAARLGGGDPTGNPRLRLLLEKSKEINMPQENAVRAIKKVRVSCLVLIMSPIRMKGMVQQI